MKKVFKIATIVLFVTLFAGTIYYLFQKSKQEPQVFTTESPKIMDIIKKTVATGAIEPRKNIELKPMVSGIVLELFVEAGDMVKIGDPIAKIKIIPDMLSLNNAENRLSNAKLKLTEIKTQHDRQQKLFEKAVISKSDFEQIDFQFKSAKEEVRSAENNLQLIREGTTQGSNVTNTIVKSTATGMILDVPVEQGFSVIEANSFNPGTTIATVADMKEMIFKGKIDESEVGKICLGMPLILTIGALEKLRFDAVLEYISPKGVKDNGAIQFEIKAQVKLNDTVFIRAGYSANADIVLQRANNVMAISESLLQFEGSKVYVEVEKSPQVFEKRTIVTGLSDGIYIEVLEGLTKTDKIKVWNQVMKM